MAADKKTFGPQNSFKINLKADENDDPNALACPHCGHRQPKKSKSANCVSCKRFMTGDTRQNWTKVEKLQYANMEQYLNKDEEEPTQVSFKKSRSSYTYLIAYFRTFAVVAVVATTIYFATPVVLKMAFGPDQYSKIEKSATTSFSQTSNTLSHLLRPVPQQKPEHKKHEKHHADKH
jgi:ribosomal protein L37AE/L43A